MITRAAIASLLALVLPACVSSSIRSDERRVRELTRIDEVVRVANLRVQQTPSQDAQKLLDAPLDADAAVRVALLNNRELRATLREMGVARGQLLQAGLLPNPVVEAELPPEEETQLELRLEYDITDAILAPSRAHAAAPALEAARYRAAAAVVELGYRVRLAFYRAQAAQQRLEVAQRALDAAAAARDASRAMAEAGNLPLLDLATQEADYERVRIAVAELELERAASREAIHRLLGLHGQDTTWRLAASLGDAPEDTAAESDLERKTIAASLRLQEMREQLEGLARRAGLARTEGWLPDVAVEVSGARSAEPEPGTDEGDRWTLGAGVSLTVPLFDRKQGTTAALESEFDALLERYYGAAVDLRSAARESQSQLASAHARARQYQQIIVPAQRRVTEQTLLQYNAMQVGIFDLLRARRQELDAELSHIDALREYWSAVAAHDALRAGAPIMMDAAAMGPVSIASDASAGGH